MQWKHLLDQSDELLDSVRFHLKARTLCNWTKCLELCFEKPASCFYGESWKKREFVQWNDCKGFLATWVRRCLSLSHPLLLPHHLSNGSSFRVPSVTTVHKQVGGAKKRFGNGKCGRASHSASISSLSSSLFGTFATLRHTWHFFLNCGWVDAVYWHTYLSCVSACVSIHWVSSSKLRMRAILTGIWILFAHLSEIVETLSVNFSFFFHFFFVHFEEMMHPVFYFPVWYLFEFGMI